MSRHHQVLTIAEVAVDLRCSKAHVYNLIAGKVSDAAPLPVIAMGRRKLVLRETLEMWKRRSQRVATSDMLPSSPEVDAVDA